MELGTLGIAIVVVIGVPLITAGYAFLAERLLMLACRSAVAPAIGRGSGWRRASPS